MSSARDAVKPTKATRLIVICWRCEFEWDADCPDCGAQTGNEDHTLCTADERRDNARGGA